MSPSRSYSAGAVTSLGAGVLRDLITIQQPNSSQDSLGRPDGWTTFADNIPAEVQDVSGLETYLVGRMIDQVTHVVKIRYLSGVVSNMRILWNSRILEIATVLQPDGRRIEHMLVCTESNP